MDIMMLEFDECVKIGGITEFTPLRPVFGWRGFSMHRAAEREITY